MARAFTYSATLPHLFNRRRLLEKNYIFAYLIGFCYAYTYPIQMFELAKCCLYYQSMQQQFLLKFER